MPVSKSQIVERLNEKVNIALGRATCVIDKILYSYVEDPIQISVKTLEIPFDVESHAYNHVINKVINSYADLGWNVTYGNNLLIFE